MTPAGRHDHRLLHAAILVSVVFLAFAERDFLDWPFLAAMLGVCVAGIVYEESTEGRSPMPDSLGNLLGAMIGIAGGAWALSEAMANRIMPVSVALIPFVAALIPALTMVKLVRKQIPRDFWVLHGLAVIQVGLGCVLGAEDAMVALLGLYATLSLGSLRSRLAGGAWPGWKALGAEGLAVGAGAFGAYWCFSGIDLPVWNPAGAFGTTRLATGYGTEVDLNHLGRVTLDDEIALEFDALDHLGNPAQTPADQRFRAVDLELYRGGRWTGSANSTGGRGVPLALPPLPTMMPRQNLLNFRVVSSEITTPVIADPALFLPVAGPMVNRRGLVRRQLAYQQIVSTGQPRDKIPLQDDVDNRFRLEDLLGAPDRLRPWGWELLESIADGGPRAPRNPTGRLPLAELRSAPGRPASLPIPLFEEAARRLCLYFSESGEYYYTLNLEKSDPGEDPVVDFLRNTRRGHCERFASGLALTLRSVGVPARLVKGFRGREEVEEGKFVVRNHHAHSWVEALVPRFERNPEQRASWDWLVLDPTPGESALLAETKAPEGLLGLVGAWLVMRQPLAREIGSWWAEAGPGGLPNWTMPALALGTGCLVLAGMRRARRKAARVGREIVPRLRALASREGIRAHAGRTPLELATEMEDLWRHDPVMGRRAGDAVWLAGEHYRWVFSGAPPDPAAARVMLAALGELEGLARESFRQRQRGVR